MEAFVLKSEYRRRLSRLYCELNLILKEDVELNVKEHSSLLPALFSVYSYMWCRRWTDLIKRVK